MTTALMAGNIESAVSDHAENNRERNENMRFLLIVPVIIMLVLTSGCYGKITGTVVDAETGQPIEGAVVLAEWTKTHGIGDHNTESFKVIEKLTDKEGKVTIEGVSNIFIDSPGVTVYKKGYVAWNNEYIFPDYKKRTDFKWKDGYVFKLDRFRPEYSYVEHDSFVSRSTHNYMGTQKKALFIKAYREGELKEILKERREKLRRSEEK